MLTAKQHETFQFICQYIEEHGYAPTTREIAEGINIRSRGVVHRYLSALAEKGYIELVSNRHRNIKVIAPLASNDELPIIGAIAAGHAIEAISEPRHINISHHFLGPDRFILQVKGDSMLGDNICDGDYIICEKRMHFDKNEILVVLVEGQDATLKRVKKNSDNTVTLIPSNPNYSPVVYPSDQVEIQGVYLGLIRLP